MSKGISIGEIRATVDELLDLAKEAGECYDFLAFASEELEPSDHRTVLGACLSGLEDELGRLSLDLLTLPIEATG